MEDDKKKQVMIGIVIACVILAVGVTLYTNTGGGGSTAKGDFFLLCTECNESFGLSLEKFREEIQQAVSEGVFEPSMEKGEMKIVNPVLTCPSCGKNTAQRATKCESCDTVFFEGSVEGDYSDRCPECDYSEMEEQMNQRQ